MTENSAQSPKSVAEILSSADQKTLLTHAVLTALTPLIPLPLVDDLAKSHFRRRLVRTLAANHNLELAPHAIPILADEPSGSCLGCVGNILIYPLSKLFRKIFIFLEWKRASDTLAVTYYHGFLLASALENGLMAPVGEHSPMDIRAAMDLVMRQTDTSPFNIVVRGVFNQSKAAVRGAVGIIQTRLRPLAQKPTPGRVGDVIDEAQGDCDALLGGVVANLQQSIAAMPAAHFLQLRARFFDELSAGKSTPSMTVIKPHTAIPGPRGHPLFGVINARPDTLNFYLSNRAKYGELTRYVALRKYEWYFVAHPDDIEQVMLGSPDLYYKGCAWERMRRVFGNGLFVSDGDLWRRQHRLVLPGFNRCNHERFAPEMIDIIADTAESWLPRARSGQAFDISAEMMRLTLMNVCRTMFGDDIREHTGAMGRALEVILHWAHLRALSWESWRGEKKFEAALKTFFGLIDRLIEKRREHHRQVGVTHDDVLDLLLLAQDESTGQPLEQAQIRDEMITIIGAGYETAAVGLAWTWHLLDRHPQISDRLRDEIGEAVGNRLPAMDDLPNMPLLKMALQEAMRLYPPIWGLSRQTQNEVELRGHRLPPKSILLMFPYVTHRHPDFWDEPEKFDPERFSPERSAGRPRFAYFPFGGGPRMCLGAGFAMLETQLIVAIIMQRYFVDVVPGHTVEPALWPSLRLKHGLMVTLRER